MDENTNWRIQIDIFWLEINLRTKGRNYGLIMDKDKNELIDEIEVICS